MAYSTQRQTSDGSLAYTDLSIKYQKRADIRVFFDGTLAAEGTWSWVGTTDKRIQYTPVVAAGVKVLIQRSTKIDTIINEFAKGAKFNNSTMDEDFQQLLYLNQEAVEGSALSDIFNDVDFHGFRIKNVGAAVDDTDVVSFGQLKGMSTGAYSAQLASEAARDLAQKWASQTPALVDGSNYSAKQYALNSVASAAAAADSQSAAAGSASSAGTSAGTATGAASTATTARDVTIAARDAALAAQATTEGVAADVLAIQDNAQDAIDIATTFDGRLTATEATATDAKNTADAATVAVAAKAAVAYVDAREARLAGVRGVSGSVTTGTANGVMYAQTAVLRPVTANGPWVRVNGISALAFTFAGTQSGSQAGGRDQAAAFASGNTVHLYAISNGTTTSTVLSTNATAPTMPSGYTHYAYVFSWVVGASSWNFPGQFQGNRHWSYGGLVTVASNTVGSTLAISTWVPSNARSYHVASHLTGTGDSNGNAIFNTTLAVTNITAANNAEVSVNTNAGGGVANQGAIIDLPYANGVLTYGIAFQAGASVGIGVQLQGYTVQNGD